MLWMLIAAVDVDVVDVVVLFAAFVYVVDVDRCC